MTSSSPCEWPVGSAARAASRIVAERADEDLVLVGVVRLHRRRADEDVAGAGARGAGRDRLAPQHRARGPRRPCGSGSTSSRRPAIGRCRACGRAADRPRARWRGGRRRAGAPRSRCSPVKASTAPLGSNGRASLFPQLDRRRQTVTASPAHGITSTPRTSMIVRCASCCSGGSSTAATVRYSAEARASSMPSNCGRKNA